MSDRDRFNDNYDPEPDYDRPTMGDELNQPERDDDWVYEHYRDRRHDAAEATPLAWADPALEAAMAAIKQAFGAINRLPHDQRAERWAKAQSHLNEAYKILLEGA